MSKRLRSMCWDYFEKTDKDFYARCSLCQQEFSYKASVSNLRKHLGRKHPNAIPALHFMEAANDENAERVISSNKLAKAPSTSQDEMIIYDVESNHSGDTNPLSTLWAYYERLPSGKIQCTICQDCVDMLDMHDHLRSEHPDLAIDDMNDLQELDTEEPKKSEESETYTEIIYLDEELQKSNQDRKSWYPKPSKKMKLRKNASQTQYIVTNQANCDQSNYINEDEEEIDRFITYLGFLLKKLPKNVSSKLQMEMMAMVMNEKHKQEHESSSLNASNIVKSTNDTQMTTN